jgi:hypothetical protein
VAGIAARRATAASKPSKLARAATRCLDCVAVALPTVDRAPIRVMLISFGS